MMTFLGRWCSALLERVMDALSIVPRKSWKVLVANFSASASLSCQKKIMVYFFLCNIFFQDEIR